MCNTEKPAYAGLRRLRSEEPAYAGFRRLFLSLGATEGAGESRRKPALFWPKAGFLWPEKKPAFGQKPALAEAGFSFGRHGKEPAEAGSAGFFWPEKSRLTPTRKAGFFWPKKKPAFAG